MTRRSRIVLAVATLGILGAALVAVLATAARSALVLRGTVAAPAEREVAAAPAPAAPGPSVESSAGEVTITGRVIELVQQRPVAGVEVVFRDGRGDATAKTGPDGAYAIRVARGSYRAFVRDDAVLSFGRRDVMRLPWDPPAEVARVPDEALMAAVLATRDTAGVDLPVVRAGIVTGHVVDPHGRPVAGAVVHAATGAIRPVLATDIAESAGDGSFELRLPPGVFELAVSHPRFAGLDGQIRRALRSDQRLDLIATLAAGCAISGRVVAPDGSPGGDGAIERQWGSGDLQFAPVGAIDAGGTFRWVTTDDGELTLRAWPWKSPPSQARRFNCRDGARFDGVVFQLPEQRPDLEGVLVDRAGRPLAFSFFDLRPLDPGGVGQQERSDGAGRWAIYRVPPGRYRLVAEAAGRGVASAVITSPRDGVRLELGGTGRLEGTTPHLASGSFELVLERCFDGGEAIALPQSRRMVTVTGGRFAVDGLPACPLSLAALWHGRSAVQQVAIPAGGVARVELDLGEPHAKTVHGVVRDAAGEPVAGAVVTVVRSDGQTAGVTAHSDASGGYTIRAFSGAGLRATARGKVARGTVGGASVESELVDLVIDDGDDADTTSR